MSFDFDPYELATRIAALTEKDQQHLRYVLATLVRCYGDDTGQAVIVFSEPNASAANLLSIRCNDTDAAEMVGSAYTYFLLVNAPDETSKEKLN